MDHETDILSKKMQRELERKRQLKQPEFLVDLSLQCGSVNEGGTIKVEEHKLKRIP